VGAIGAKPPLDLCNLLISGGFQAPTGAEPPLERKKCKPPPGQIPEYTPDLKTKHFRNPVFVNCETS